MKSCARYFSAMLVLALALPTAARAQNTSPVNVLPPVRLEVAALSEVRQLNSPPQLNLSVRAADASMPPNEGLLQITVTNVVDGLGNSLMSMPSSRRVGPPYFLITFLVGRQPFAIPLPTFPGLPRKAKSLRLVEGTLEFYQPTEANGAIIRIPNISSHAGQLEHPALIQHGISFRFLGNQASKNEAMANGNFVEVNRGQIDSINAIGYYFGDPAGLVVSAEIQDGAGRPITTDYPDPTSNDIALARTVSPSSPLLVSLAYRRLATSRIVTVPLLEPLTADSQLVIRLAVPAAFKTAPFRLENIPLP